MKRILQYYYLIAGLLIAAIGVIHCMMAPMMSRQMKTVEVLKDKVEGIIYFFVLGGIAFVYWGILLALTRKRIDVRESWGFVLPVSAMGLIAMSGILAVVYARFSNPLIYVMTLLGLSGLVFAGITRVMLAKKGPAI